MPLRLGLLVYPLLAAGLMAGRRGAVSTFIKAGATSLETARRPSGLGIAHLEDVQAAVKRGVLVSVGDGRLYVNLAIYRRRRNVLVGGIVAAGAACTFAMLMLYHPWSG